MADIRHKDKLFAELDSLSSGVQFPAQQEGDQETLALAQVIQYSLSAVKDPARRDQLIRAIALLKEIPSDQDIYEELHNII